MPAKRKPGDMEVSIKTIKVSAIKLNPDNPRKITGTNMDRLVQSLIDFPEMMELREIVVDEDTMALGGNMRTLALRKAGIKDAVVKVVTGLSDEQKREFVIKDNASFGEYDWDLLANAWDDLPLADWGVDLPGDWVTDGSSDNKDDNNYSRNITAPIYEPKGDKPSLAELFDDTKANELIKAIDETDLPAKEKDFLKIAARRHTVLSYNRIAEYYAHSGEKVQRLMEDSALVIIDFDRAIELGYVKLSEEIAKQYGEDYPDA